MFDRMIEPLEPSSRAFRTAAFESFDAAAMPTQKLERWKYVDLGFDLKQIPVATGPGDPLEPGPFLGSITDREASVVVIDGTVTEVTSGSEADIRSFSDLDDLQIDRVASLIDADRDIFAAARSAFSPDAVVVTAPRGVTVSGPVVIDLQATSATSSFPRVAVVAEENAEIGVIVMFRSADGEPAVIVPQIGLHAEAGARIRYVGVQNVAFEATAVVHQKVEIGRDATVRTGEVGLGGKVGRLDLEVDLEGQGSSAEVLGVYFGEYDQTLDYRMLIHHKGRNSSSDVFLKGAVEDDAQSVFTGLLKIDKGAERTSAFETNRNLVLSEGAKAHSVPNLEIECDDVVCGHGSSVGPLETEHLYYLRSRGLSTERAERLMIKGFFNEIIDRLPVSGLAEPVREELFARFVEAQREGRVA